MGPKRLLEEKGYCVVELSPKSDIMGRAITSKYTIIGLCLSGSVIYELNLERVKAHAGMRLAFPHVSMLTTMEMTPDFKALVLVMDDDFALESSVGIESEKVHAIFRNALRVVEDEQEWKLLLTFMEGLLIYQAFNTSSISRQIAGSLFRDILLLLSDTEASQAHGNVPFSNYSMADTYFRNFINLVNDNVRREHEVSYYASQLNISPKYLGEICKQKSGRKAKEIISAVLLAQLKRDIILSGMSMKTLAFSFGFSDQSSLGKFFRKMTGMSPRAFKQQQFVASVEDGE